MALAEVVVAGVAEVVVSVNRKNSSSRNEVAVTSSALHFLAFGGHSGATLVAMHRHGGGLSHRSIRKIHATNLFQTVIGTFIETILISLCLKHYLWS
jgi:hypothetical protein